MIIWKALLEYRSIGKQYYLDIGLIYEANTYENRKIDGADSNTNPESLLGILESKLQ
jgi:hypothetical protein